MYPMCDCDYDHVLKGDSYSSERRIFIDVIIVF